MGIKKIKLAIFIFLLSIFNVSLALEAPSNIKLDKAWEDFLEISWDPVENAWVYSISYWEKSVSGTTNHYEHDEEIVVETNSWKIENLNSNTTYYIAVKAYDDNEQSSDYSKEVSFKTAGDLQNLKLEKVEVLDLNTIELYFNTDLKNDSLVDLSITNKENNENIEIQNYEINWNKLKVYLQKQLEKTKKYSIVVIAVEWNNWELIKNWVDWTIDFVVPENLWENTNQEENEEFNSAWLQEENNIQETNSWAVEEQNNQNSENNNSTQNNHKPKVLWWKVIENNNTNSIEQTAKKVKEMPQTWPAQTALFLIFSFIASILFFTLRRRIK